MAMDVPLPGHVSLQNLETVVLGVATMNNERLLELDRKITLFREN